MDWSVWFREIGVRGLLPRLAVLPVLYAVGYMGAAGLWSQVAIGVISAMVPGDTYSHKLGFAFIYLEQYGWANHIDQFLGRRGLGLSGLETAHRHRLKEL